MMKVSFRKSAEKELLKLDQQLALRTADKIKLLGDNPYGQGSQKLADEKGYRIRVGDYRVIYTIDKDSQVVTIVKIGHRREVYK